MNDERFEMIKKAMEDDEYVKKMAECKGKEDYKNVLLEKGITMTEDEIEAFTKTVQKGCTEETELSEEELVNVNGGVGIAVACAICAGAYVAGRVYMYYAKRKLGYC